MKTIKLPCFGIVVELDENGNGTITSNLQDGPPDLVIDSAIDGLEALILGHACAGIDIESPAYIQGIGTAVEAISNNG